MTDDFDFDVKEVAGFDFSKPMRLRSLPVGTIYRDCDGNLRTKMEKTDELVGNPLYVAYPTPWNPLMIKAWRRNYKGVVETAEDDLFGEDDLKDITSNIESAREFVEENLPEENGLWVLASYSKFHGGAAGRANVQYFKDNYPNIIKVVGSYVTGEETVGIPEEKLGELTPATMQRLSRDLATLQDQVYISDAHYADAEQELRDRAWSGWINRQFMQDLNHEFPQFEEQLWDLDAEGERRLFEALRDYTGAEWYEGEDGDQYVNVDDILKGTDEKALRDFLFKEPGAQLQLNLESLINGDGELHWLAETAPRGFERRLRRAISSVYPWIEQDAGAEYANEEEPELTGYIVTFVLENYDQIVQSGAAEDWAHDAVEHAFLAMGWHLGHDRSQHELELLTAAIARCFGVVEALQEAREFSCVLAPAPPDLRDYVLRWGQMNVTDDEVYDDDAHDYGREDDPHVTVKFGLHDARPSEELLKIIEGTQPFEIEVGPASFFEAEKYDVLKFDVTGDGLYELNRRISEEIECTDTHPEYHAHMTVSYVQKGCARDLAGKLLRETDNPAELRFLVKTVKFSSKDGNKYTLFLGKPNEDIEGTGPVHEGVIDPIERGSDPVALAREVIAQFNGKPPGDSLVVLKDQSFYRHPGWEAFYAPKSGKIYVSRFVFQRFAGMSYATQQNLEDYLASLLKHELIHYYQDQGVAQRGTRDEYFKDWKAKRDRLKQAGAPDLAAYFTDPHEIMAYAELEARKLMKRSGGDLKKALSDLSKSNVVHWISRDDFPGREKANRQYKRYVYDYLQKFAQQPQQESASVAKCRDCGRPTHGEYYRLRDDVWAETGLTEPGMELCIGCVENRLGRRLTHHDFDRIQLNTDPDIPRSDRLKDRLSEAQEGTVVIHLDDRSTDFLKAIYDGKGYPVVNGKVSPKELMEIIKNADRLYMMGHGAPQGLFGDGYMIGDQFGPLLREKKDGVYIWCNADAYAARNKLNGLVSGMFISEVGEAAYFGLTVSQEEVDASNAAFARICREVIDRGDPYSAVRDCYMASNAACRITKFNAERLYVFNQGEPTPVLHQSSAYHQELRYAKDRQDWDAQRAEREAKHKAWRDRAAEGESVLYRLRGQLASAAQTVYDQWEQDEEGIDPMLGAGGLCQDIADAMVDVLSANGIEATIVDTSVGDQHVWAMANVNDVVFSVDIPPSVYETGSGYVWKKRQGVTFEPDDVIISPEDVSWEEITESMDEAKEPFDVLLMARYDGKYVLQYDEGRFRISDDNQGRGYTHQEAQAKADEIRREHGFSYDESAPVLTRE